MPSTLFFQINEDKRQRFIEASLEEFASFEYERASVSQIVKKLGIAKGTLYNYFDTKLDLYLYLVEQAEIIFKAQVEENVKPSKNLKKWFASYLMCICEFHHQFPLHSAILTNSKNEKFSAELGQVFALHFEKDLLFFKSKIVESKGLKLKKDVETHMAFVLLTSSRYFPEYLDIILKNKNQNLHKIKEQLEPLTRDILKDYCKEFAGSTIC